MRCGSEELVTPFSETITTVFCLFGVCVRCLLQPLDKQLLILLQHQILTQDHISLCVDEEFRKL